MTGKKEHIKNFKCDDDFLKYLGELALNLPDYNLSEIIRQSILIAAPFLKEHPRCAKMIGIPRGDCQ
jgi:hypothetical protein